MPPTTKIIEELLKLLGAHAVECVVISLSLRQYTNVNYGSGLKRLRENPKGGSAN
jgi:hypothetical protein